VDPWWDLREATRPRVENKNERHFLGMWKKKKKKEKEKEISPPWKRKKGKKGETSKNLSIRTSVLNLPLAITTTRQWQQPRKPTLKKGKKKKRNESKKLRKSKWLCRIHQNLPPISTTLSGWTNGVSSPHPTKSSNQEGGEKKRKEEWIMAEGKLPWWSSWQRPPPWSSHHHRRTPRHTPQIQGVSWTWNSQGAQSSPWSTLACC